MAKTTTLQVLTTDTNGKAMTKPINYANPNASDSVLSAFAKACNGLTTNTYVDTYRVDRISLNESTAE